MTAIPWAEGADLDLASAKEHYRALRRALREENFRRPLAKLLSEGDRLRGSTSTRVERARKRTDPLVVKAVDRLWESCVRERDAAMEVAYRLALKRRVFWDGDDRELLEVLSRPVPPRPLVRRDWTAWRDFWKRVSTLRTPLLLGVAAVLLLPLSVSLGGAMGTWLVLGTSGVALSLAIAFKDPVSEPPPLVVHAPPVEPPPEERVTVSAGPVLSQALFWLVAVPAQAFGSLVFAGCLLGLIGAGLLQLLR